MSTTQTPRSKRGVARNRPRPTVFCTVGQMAEDNEVAAMVIEDREGWPDETVPDGLASLGLNTDTAAVADHRSADCSCR